jgi:hypothetical protein
MRITVLRRVGLLAGVVVAAAVFGVSSAKPTTGLGYQFVIGVRLTDHGVAFTKQQRVPRGSVVQFIIANLSHQRRRFNIGGRQTKLLKPKAREVFFLGFDIRGAIHYRSFGPAAHVFAGSFSVT